MSTPQPTPPGSRRFEAARQRLAKLLAVEVENVPDAEVRIYLEQGAPPEAGWPADGADDPD